MRTLELHDGVVRMIDQRRLPRELVIQEIRDYRTVATAIREMWIRGAPAIGAAGAFGLALAANESRATTRDEMLRDLDEAANVLRATRPTAVNLGWALDRVMNKARAANLPATQTRELVVSEAQAIADEDVETNRRLAENGAALIHDGDTLIHHCNTGPLATVDIGTALGCIIRAHQQGKRVHVLVDETRPRLQGARLTTWELMQHGVPMTLITDGASGYYMRKGTVAGCFVGADRVAANGDFANKIGTYNLAVVAHENGVPFYVAVPTSSIDMNLESGDDITIEERAGEEITAVDGVRIAPDGVRAGNPAFDVTPHKYVTALVTEKGLVHPPFKQNLLRIIDAE